MWVLLSASFVLDDDGVPVSGTTRVQDTTERTRREERLRLANAQPVASNAELERFAWVASQDLHSPRATLRSRLDMVRTCRGEQLPRDVMDWVGQAHQHTDRSIATVDAVLTLARASHTSLVTAPADDNTVLDELLPILAPVRDESAVPLSIGLLPSVAPSPRYVSHRSMNARSLA